MAATSNGGSNSKTCDRNSRRSQIKKSKLNLVTAFKVGFHFFFRISAFVFGWAGILLTNETIILQTFYGESIVIEHNRDLVKICSNLYMISCAFNVYMKCCQQEMQIQSLKSGR